MKLDESDWLAVVFHVIFHIEQLGIEINEKSRVHSYCKSHDKLPELQSITSQAFGRCSQETTRGDRDKA